MAPGQSILNRLKALKEGADIPGVLPMAAYYRREPEAEAARGAMYKAVAEVSRMTDEQLEEALSRLAGEEKKRKTGPSFRIIDLIESVAVINNMAGPLEYLVSCGDMETESDVEGMGGARFHTALKLRDLFEGAQVKGLRSPSLSGTGGGGAQLDIRAYQMDCMKLLQRVKSGMAVDWAFPLLESVLLKDEWLNLGPDAAGKKGREMTVVCFHYALDCAGAVLGYLPEEDVTLRWPDRPPTLPRSVRHHTRASTAANQLGLLTSRGVRQA